MSEEEALKHLESSTDYISDAQTKVLDAAKESDSEVLTEICEHIHDDLEDRRRKIKRFVMLAEDLRQREDDGFDELDL